MFTKSDYQLENLEKAYKEISFLKFLANIQRLITCVTYIPAGGAINSAKIALTSARQWINGMMQDIEEEMRKHNQRQISTEEIDTTTSKMIITDSQRRGEIQTIGDLIGNEENPEVPIG